MSDTKTVAGSSAWVSPISYGVFPPEGSRAVGSSYNWNTAAFYDDDLSRLQSLGVLTAIQAVMIDNSTNTQSVTLIFPGTHYEMTCPALSQAVFPILLGDIGWHFKISTAAAVNAVTRCQWVNYPLGPSVQSLGAVAPSYVGPGDLVSSATMWYGLRAYNAAAASGTTKAINIRRTSDNATADILILSTGALDVATAATFMAATTAYVTTWYDQSGNGHNAVQATAANQPQLLLSAISGLPAVAGTGASQPGLVPPTSTIAQPYSLSTSGITGSGLFIYGSYNAIGQSSGKVVLNDGTDLFTGTYTTGSAHTFQFIGNSPSSQIYLDSTTATVTGDSGSHGFTSNPRICDYNVNVGELGVWAFGLTPTQQAQLYANQKAYWGTP